MLFLLLSHCFHSGIRYFSLSHSQISSHLKLQGELSLSLYSFLLSEVLPYKFYPSLFPHLTKIAGLFWVPPLCAMAWNTLQAVRWYNFWAYLICLLFFSEIAVLSCLYPMSENSYLAYFVQFSGFYCGREIAVAVYLSCAESEINTFLTFQISWRKGVCGFCAESSYRSLMVVYCEGTDTNFQSFNVLSFLYVWDKIRFSWFG